MNNNMKIIIVGASGYIGSSILEFKKHRFATYGTSSTAKSGLLRLDLNEIANFDFSFIQPKDTVLLASAISSPDVCASDHAYAYSVNVSGTSEFIAKVMTRGGRVIFFSSDTVYGERDDEFDEHATCNPVGEYAEMKREVEKKFLGNPLFKVIRLSYVFSREDKFVKYLLSCAKRNEEAEIFHPFYRAIIHRDDVVEGAISLVKRWDEFSQIKVFNFGGPEVLARTEFVKILQDIALSNLRFHLTEPNADYFRNRPKVIRMASPILVALLGRSAHTLHEAANIEFYLKEDKQDD